MSGCRSDAAAGEVVTLSRAHPTRPWPEGARRLSPRPVPGRMPRRGTLGVALDAAASARRFTRRERPRGTIVWRSIEAPRLPTRRRAGRPTRGKRARETEGIHARRRKASSARGHSACRNGSSSLPLGNHRGGTAQPDGARRRVASACRRGEWMPRTSIVPSSDDQDRSFAKTHNAICGSSEQPARNGAAAARSDHHQIETPGPCRLGDLLRGRASDEHRADRSTVRAQPARHTLHEPLTFLLVLLPELREGGLVLA